MTNPQPGWYPDPGGTAPYRWWNGQAWTTATSDGTPTPQVAAVTGASTATAASTNPTENPATTAYGTPSPFNATSTHAQVVTAQQAKNTDLYHQNQWAFGTFIAVALAIFLALAGFVFVAVTPAWMAYVSRDKNEPLAPLAVGAAVIAVVIGIAAFTR